MSEAWGNVPVKEPEQEQFKRGKENLDIVPPRSYVSLLQQWPWMWRRLVTLAATAFVG